MGSFERLQKQLNQHDIDLIVSTQKQVIEVYKKLDDEINKTILDIYKKYNLPILTDGKPDGVKTVAFMRNKIKVGEGVRITRLRALQNDIRRLMNPALLRKDKFLEEMAGILLQSGYYEGIYAIENTTGLNLNYTILNERAIEAAVKSPTSIFADSTLKEVDKLKLDRAQAIGQINKEIEMALARGDSAAQLSKKIDQILGFRDSKGNIIKSAKYKKGQTYKSLRIARTELLRTLSDGRTMQFLETRDQLEDEGIEPKLKLVATLDTRTRAQSASMDGQYSDKDGKFKYPDGQWYYPHNTGNPAWDINDREIVIQVMEGLEPVIRRSRKEGIIPNITFKEWAEKLGIKKSIYGEKYYF